MKYKLLFLDVDGTLVSQSAYSIDPANKYNAKLGQELSRENINAIQKAKDSGIQICLCTGRGLGELREIISSADLTGFYHVVENGAVIMGSNLSIERELLLSREEAEIIVRKALQKAHALGICSEGVWYAKLEDVGENAKSSIVSFHAKDNDQINHILDSLTEFKSKYAIVIGSHWEFKEGGVVMVTNREASKGSAIEYLQKKLNIEKSQTAGIGDMPNDLPMFTQCGLKIAMGNAHEDVKIKADIIAPPVDENGVAWAIENVICSQT